MNALVLLLALGAQVTDEAGVLSASKRADLFVAADEQVEVLVFHGRGDEGAATRRAAVLARTGAAVVVFDVSRGCGALRPAHAPVDAHQRRALEHQRLLLCDTARPWFERVLGAVQVMRATASSPSASAEPPTATTSGEATRPGIVLALIVVGWVVQFARNVVRLARRRRGATIHFW
ncbi:MAG: hypothetical protein ACOZQL_20510 [Myxococcota bacterium]